MADRLMRAAPAAGDALPPEIDTTVTHIARLLLGNKANRKGEHEAGVIVYNPMASGLLTGAFTTARAAVLEPGDWRAGHPDCTGAALSANLALAERGVGRRMIRVTPAAVAVAKTLAFPGVTGAIVGVRSPRQVDGWLPVACLAALGRNTSSTAVTGFPEPHAECGTSGQRTGYFRPYSGLLTRRNVKVTCQ